MEEKLAIDVQGLLDWIAYQEDFRGSTHADKAKNWDTLKETLASLTGVEEPKISMFKYKEDDAEPKKEG